MRIDFLQSITILKAASYRTWLNRDALCVLLLFGASYLVGTYHLRHWGGQAQFYQKYYAPAVSLACGNGFSDIEVDVASRLQQFLSLETDCFDCADFPLNPARKETNVYLWGEPYLMQSIGTYWRLFGVSWSGLNRLAAVLFGLSIVCVYGVLRLVSSRTIGMLIALFSVISLPHLTYLPHVREYAKTPFFLLFILLLMAIILKPLKTGRFLGLCGAAGLAVGCGYGFRADLLVCIPALAIGILLFLPGGVLRHMGIKLAGIGLFIGVFFIFSFPISRHGTLYNSAHVVLLGKSMPFNNTLGIRGGLYDHGHLYKDNLVDLIFNSYGEIVEPRKIPTGVYFEAYEMIGRRYLLQLLKTFRQMN